MKVSTKIYRRFTLAPMMDWSDRHCRYLWRLISRHAVVYSEMVTTGALLNNKQLERYLGFNQAEHPIALQLGGSDPAALGACAKLAEDWGYDEVNLNCGCPSDRVQEGKIGAILMAEPQLVADCIKAMQDSCDIDVTIKHRIGIDDMEDYADMCRFVEAVAATGCNTFIVHARKAWLQGLSPKQNREVPPLRYPLVHQLKQDYPELEIIINGGLKSLDDCEQQLQQVDGVMIGREAYSNPYLLAEVDKRLYNDKHPIASRCEIFKQYMAYTEMQLAQGQRLHYMSRHVLGLFQGQAGARAFRRHISENASRADAGIEVLQQALNFIQC
ncbi:MAG: tRNA dihydrouridine(20/20a) synthase DusA [Cellvibrionaceae bacterium]|nr:tRNA dihydrouridine(20/20a) synthase DusA [Cellvibrionaceae bacterium]